jgi:hypothetical protein
LSIALGTKRHAGSELTNCTKKLCSGSLRELKTAPYAFYLCQTYFLIEGNLTILAVGIWFVAGVFMLMQYKIAVKSVHFAEHRLLKTSKIHSKD